MLAEDSELLQLLEIEAVARPLEEEQSDPYGDAEEVSGFGE
ncbi:hypothetical protein [Actinomadura sp. 21ATH]